MTWDEDGHETRERDLLLVREHPNTDDEQLVAHQIRYFDDPTPSTLPFVGTVYASSDSI